MRKPETVKYRYKNYDERFVKDIMIYVNSNEEIASNGFYAYKDEAHTRKFYSDELKSAFDNGCVVIFSDSNSDIMARPFAYVGDNTQSLFYIAAAVDGAAMIYSGDSKLD